MREGISWRRRASSHRGYVQEMNLHANGKMYARRPKLHGYEHFAHDSNELPFRPWPRRPDLGPAPEKALTIDNVVMYQD